MSKVYTMAELVEIARNDLISPLCRETAVRMAYMMGKRDQLSEQRSELANELRHERTEFRA